MRTWLPPTALLLATLFVAAPPALAQEVKLTASDGERADLFGQAVALSADGQTALVGAWQHDEPVFLAGAAYVFVRDGAGWTEQAKLNASGAATGDEFGAQGAVALSADGHTALVGASGDDDTFFLSGSAFVFTRTGTAWAQEAKLVADDPTETARLGRSVALSADGHTALVGASLDGGPGSMTGSAYVFTRTGTTWAQEAKLVASDAADLDGFGGDVALSADGLTAIVGAQSDGGGVGAAYVFARSGASWSEEAKLTASDGAANALFGKEVALSANGTYAVVGAYLDDEAGSDAGAVYVFTRAGTAWGEQAKLAPAAAGAQFGYAVAVDDGGTVLLGGANADDTAASDGGAAYVFTRSGAIWTEARTVTAGDAADDDFFGRAVALSADGTVALVGADGDDDNGDDAGAAYVVDGLVATAADEGAAPAVAALSAPAPNPFADVARLTLTLPRPAPVRVVLYDLLGRAVRVLHEGMADATLPLRIPGASLPAGLYVVRAQTPTAALTRTLVRR